MATSSRILVLLSLLQARRDWSGQILAERLAISPRTVRRDIERLRDLGYRIHTTKGPDGGYRLDAGSELPPLLFDDEQAVVLAVALQTVTVSGTDLEDAAARALTTVRQVMPPRLRHRIDSLQIVPLKHLGGAGAPTVSTEVLVALGGAVRAREVIRFDYAASGSAAPSDTARADPGPPGSPQIASTPTESAPARTRRVEPHHVVTRAGRWYLVGWDLDRADWRIFRVDRITLRSGSGPRFRRRDLPGDSVHTFVAARFKGPAAGDIWPCTGEVVLALPWTQVLPFAGDATVEDLGTDRCRVTSGSWSWPALAASIGRFDADIECAEPAELRAAFGLLARRYADARTGAGQGRADTSGEWPLTT